MPKEPFGFYEFFAGGGMARLGLGPGWRSLFANDNSNKKAAAYRRNFPPASDLLEEDIQKVRTKDLPGKAALAWASFPCQDLSLAGRGDGLKGHRSSTFFPFWDLMKSLGRENRRPPLILLENVVGAITSNGGNDFRTILEVVSVEGYAVGAMVLDAVYFVPQSRPRLFLLAAEDSTRIPESLIQNGPASPWHSRAIQTAVRNLPEQLREKWIWWKLPVPPPLQRRLSDLLEDKPAGTKWHTPAETQRLLSLMSDVNRRKVKEAQARGAVVVGTLYRRTRPDGNGGKVQRAEVRFDQISGCLRTPAGGSSRQTILVVRGLSVRSRPLSPREAARLMGVPDTYRLPENYNEAYHLMGDGLAPPVVSWLEKHLLRPLAESLPQRRTLNIVT
ncbi:MAG: DNA cytosine methyltransferase [Candidatus Sumerlaeota bacterium]|nr:DNA cytosine methyltransferase [Candidatus Sumerlaeota bacterium]